MIIVVIIGMEGQSRNPTGATKCECEIKCPSSEKGEASRGQGRHRAADRLRRRRREAVVSSRVVESSRVVYVESVLAGASSRKKDQEEEMWPWKGADFWLVWRERER